MGRPPKEIKYRIDGKTGLIMVAFIEAPGCYHSTPERPDSVPLRADDPGFKKALAWARRNKTRLLAVPEKPLLFRDLAKGSSRLRENGIETV